MHLLRVHVFWTVLSFVSLHTWVLPMAASPQAASTATPERRALDPLTPDEQNSAVRIAESDNRVRQLLHAQGIRVVSVLPVVTKPESLQNLDYSTRQAEVVLFQPQGEVGARVLVNLHQNEAVNVQPLRSDQVPMTVDDLNDAFQLGIRDSAVQRALGSAAESFRPLSAMNQVEDSKQENLVTGLPLHSTDPKDPCFKHRCMELFFRRGPDYLSEPIVLVDLTAKHVYVERSKSK
jgi:hypothetical protein